MAACGNRVGPKLPVGIGWRVGRGDRWWGVQATLSWQLAAALRGRTEKERGKACCSGWLDSLG